MSCKSGWGGDEVLWTVGLDDDIGTRELNVFLYPYSECSREIAEGVIAPNLHRSLEFLHRRERLNSFDVDLDPLGSIWCLAYQEYPDFEFSPGDSKFDEFTNAFSAFEDWREQNICTPGVHALVLAGHEWAEAERVDMSSGNPSAFTTEKHAVIGTAGNLDKVVNLSLMEILHTAIDSESVEEVRNLLDPGAAGDASRAEHQLGTLYGGAVSPMATLYEGSTVAGEYTDPDGRGRHAAYGECSNDAQWNGMYTQYLSDCTVKAILHTRDAAMEES